MRDQAKEDDQRRWDKEHEELEQLKAAEKGMGRGLKKTKNKKKVGIGLSGSTGSSSRRRTTDDEGVGPSSAIGQDVILPVSTCPFA